MPLPTQLPVKPAPDAALCPSMPVKPFAARTVPLPRREWDSEDVPGFFVRGEPVVLSGGCPLARQLVGAWSFDHLEQAFDGTERLQVHFAPRDCNNFARVYGDGL